MPPRRCLADKKGSVSTGLCSGGDDNECCDLVGYYSCGDRGKGECLLLCLDEGGVGLNGRLDYIRAEVCVQDIASLLQRSVMGVGRVGIVRMGMILSVVFECMSRLM